MTRWAVVAGVVVLLVSGRAAALERCDDIGGDPFNAWPPQGKVVQEYSISHFQGTTSGTDFAGLCADIVTQYREAQADGYRVEFASNGRPRTCAARTTCDGASLESWSISATLVDDDQPPCQGLSGQSAGAVYWNIANGTPNVTGAAEQCEISLAVSACLPKDGQCAGEATYTGEQVANAIAPDGTPPNTAPEGCVVSASGVQVCAEDTGSGCGTVTGTDGVTRQVCHNESGVGELDGQPFTTDPEGCGTVAGPDGVEHSVCTSGATPAQGAPDTDQDGQQDTPDATVSSGGAGAGGGTGPGGSTNFHDGGVSSGDGGDGTGGDGGGGDGGGTGGTGTGGDDGACGDGGDCNDTVSGGTSCDAPPSCSGSPINCYIAEAAWAQACAQQLDKPAAAASVDDALGEGEGGDGLIPDIGDPFDVSSWFTGIDSTTGGCLSDIQITAQNIGGVITVPLSHACTIVQLLRALILIGASLISLRIVSGAF